MTLEINLRLNLQLGRKSAACKTIKAKYGVKELTWKIKPCVKKKKGIIETLNAFFEKFFGIGADFDEDLEEPVLYESELNPEEPLKVAESQEEFDKD